MSDPTPEEIQRASRDLFVKLLVPAEQAVNGATEAKTGWQYRMTCAEALGVLERVRVEILQLQMESVYFELKRNL